MDEPEKQKGEGLHVSTYNFKCNIGQYMRRLRLDPRLDHIVLKKYNKAIAIIVPIPD